MRYVYTGNVDDPEGESTYCPPAASKVIGRDGYEITAGTSTPTGDATSCGEPCPGVFEEEPGTWGARRLPVSLKDFAFSVGGVQ